MNSGLTEVIAGGGAVAIVAAIVWAQHRTLTSLISDFQKLREMVTALTVALARLETTISHLKAPSE